MAGGNWDPIQTLKDGLVQSKGEMPVMDAYSEPTWLDAWVVQGGGETAGQVLLPGPCQSSRHSPLWSGWGNAPYTTWAADEPGWVSGKGSFQSGTAALGIALLATYNTADHTTAYEWWFQVIALQ
jgi:hypothetical protein